ncbi:MAG TPA: methionine--tRNA ligase [Bacteroidales bacterium]|nr:methionine--tRNA ligase [Bacteroidales bacterium]
MKKFKQYTVTAALPYANGPLHIGHIAGAYLPADIYVRYLRMKKKDVIFVCGSDEHGAAITLRAKKEGTSPKSIIDKYHEMNKKAFADFGINFDIYHRTSDSLHHKTAQDFFTKLNNKGAFTIKKNKQFYDEENKLFLADRYISGTCPKCGYEQAYGDQCEKCGSSLSPLELINPKSTISGNVPVLKETFHWYLPMQNHEKWLKQWINDGILDGEKVHDPTTWRNQVIGQCNSWLDGGLHERAMTRDLNWGVKVPVENTEGKVLYVWLDAPIGYISATKALTGNDWERYWKSKDTKLVHFIGKDNIVFHAIIFPIILREYGEFILPENVPANEFLNLENDKLSTSRNWAVWLHEYLEDFKDKQDILRYTLTSIAPETKDSEFTWKDFQAKNNNELLAILGNFINRTFVLIQKYYDKKIPPCHILNNSEKQILESIHTIRDKVENLIEHYHFRYAQKEAMNLARIGNKYLTESEPWKIINTDSQKTETILHICAQIAANLAIIMEPFIPFTATKLKRMLNLPDKLSWDKISTNLLPENHIIQKPFLLFSRIEDNEIEHQIKKLLTTKQKNETTISPVKETIQYDDFTKMDIRSATILEAEKIPKTKKLLKIILDTGIDQRTVVSGIAEYFSPEEIIGKQVLVLVNLAPRKLRGIESQGMILMANSADGKLVFVSPDNKIKNGSIIS